MKMGKKLLISTVTLAAVVIALFLAPVGAQPSRQTECSFAGVWRTTYGEMPLQQSGASVTGTYGAQAVKRVEGTFREGVLTGSWSHPPTFSAENNQAGDVRRFMSFESPQTAKPLRAGANVAINCNAVRSLAVGGPASLLPLQTEPLPRSPNICANCLYCGQVI